MAHLALLRRVHTVESRRTVGSNVDKRKKKRKLFQPLRHPHPRVNVHSSALVDDAKTVLQRPGVIVDRVDNLLILRHALFLLRVERPLERRNLRQDDGLELVVVRVGSPRHRRRRRGSAARPRAARNKKTSTSHHVRA